MRKECVGALGIGLGGFLLTLAFFFLAESFIYHISWDMFLYSLTSDGVLKVVYALLTGIWMFLSELREKRVLGGFSLGKASPLTGAVLLPLACSCGPLTAFLVSLLGGIGAGIEVGVSFFLYALFSLALIYFIYKEWRALNFSLQRFLSFCGIPFPNQ